MSAETKECGRCHLTLPLAEFPLEHRRKQAHVSYCKPCKAEYMAEYRELRRKPKRADSRAGGHAEFESAVARGDLWTCVLLDERAMMHSLDFDRALRQRPVCNCPVIGRRRAEHLRDVHSLEGTDAQVEQSFSRSRPVADRMVAP